MADFATLYAAAPEPASFLVQEAGDAFGRYLVWSALYQEWGFTGAFQDHATPLSQERAAQLAAEHGGRVIPDRHRRQPQDPQPAAAEHRRLCDRADYGFIGRGER